MGDKMALSTSGRVSRYQLIYVIISSIFIAITRHQINRHLTKIVLVTWSDRPCYLLGNATQAGFREQAESSPNHNLRVLRRRYKYCSRRPLRSRLHKHL